ncbi:MAG: hypothetical protein LBJ67_11280 [Planctomycetaceae bacterium]|jgi:hypothetical protein|nr:hypothetical protein [Planctomycetaceae bacterium]
MFNNLFKSKKQREMDRNIAVQRALALHRQQVGKLEQHERGYMEKALRAKKAGDQMNFRRLCTMVAQTVNERRAIESQLLYFEMMLQTRDKAKLFQEFAGGMKAMTKSIGEAFKEVNTTEIMSDLEKAMAQSGEMESAMNLVLDRISASQNFSNIPDGGVTAEQIEAMLSEKTALENDSLDKQIESGLARLQQSLVNPNRE